MIKAAINGYGRIGRVAHRIILERHSNEIEVVAINAGRSTDIDGWLNLLKYDTVYKQLQNTSLEARSQESNEEPKQLGQFIINNKEVQIFAERNPEALPWKDLDIDVVIESTGVFTKREDLEKHITAGAKAVVLSAPAKGDNPVPTYVRGVNLTDNKVENIISNASCTTNCIAPVAQIILENFGVQKAMMTTIHGYTSDQRLQDGGHKDKRRARAAALNIIPTSTGATKAAALALPKLKGIFDGMAVRVPVPVGSLADFTFLTEKNTSIEEVNKALVNASEQDRYKNIFKTTTDPIVSSDIIGEAYSSIADLSLTQVVGDNMVKVVAWYDNEFGYGNRLVEEAIAAGKTHSE